MQSNGARALVALGSVALIVVLFVVLSSGGEDSGGGEAEPAAQTGVGAETTPAEASGQGGEGEKPAKEKQPEEPAVDTIVVVGGEPKGGIQKLNYGKGERVRLEVRSDIDEHVHVHGYDLFEDVAAGGKAKFSFPADIDGVFEIELEDSGIQLAQLTVKP